MLYFLKLFFDFFLQNKRIALNLNFSYICVFNVVLLPQVTATAFDMHASLTALVVVSYIHTQSNHFALKIFKRVWVVLFGGLRHFIWYTKINSILFNLGLYIKLNISVLSQIDHILWILFSTEFLEKNSHTLRISRISFTFIWRIVFGYVVRF